MTPSSPAAEVAGVRITHPDRVVDAGPRLTKLDVAGYVAGMADRIAAARGGASAHAGGLRGRPGAGCFYMRHSNIRAPQALRRIAIPEKTKVLRCRRWISRAS